MSVIALLAAAHVIRAARRAVAPTITGNHALARVRVLVLATGAVDGRTLACARPIVERFGVRALGADALLAAADHIVVARMSVPFPPTAGFTHALALAADLVVAALP